MLPLHHQPMQSHKDSNLDPLSQSQICCRYTMGLWSRVAYGLSALAFTLMAVTACLRTFELPARVVGMSGLEPLIFALSERCTNQLCYIPLKLPLCQDYIRNGP